MLFRSAPALPAVRFQRLFNMRYIHQYSCAVPQLDSEIRSVSGQLHTASVDIARQRISARGNPGHILILKQAAAVTRRFCDLQGIFRNVLQPAVNRRNPRAGSNFHILGVSVAGGSGKAGINQIVRYAFYDS